MSQQNFKKQSDAQTFVPDENYLALFYSTDLNQWAYKDEFGTTQLFVSETVIARSLYARVRNQTGSTVPALRVVYISGASGQLPLISLAQANSEITSSKTFAVTREGINNNSNGNVIVSGVIENVNTSAFAAGDLLWLSAATPGLITNVRPTQPDNAVFIGYCVSSSPTSGSIEVKIQNGYELDELHNVLITSVADKNVLKYDSATSLWKNGTIAKAEVGLGNVDNTSDANKPVSTATQTALDLKINSSLIGAANGVAPLDGDSKIPAIYIPGSIEEVLEFANLAAFPVTGVTSKMYVALDTNKVYRWSGSAYVEISASPGSTDAVPEGVTNLYFTEPRVRGTVLTGLSLLTNAVISATDSVLSAFGKIQKQVSDNLTTLTNHIANLSNPHAVTKTQVGLGNVDNTADMDKPISTATQSALDLKQPLDGDLTAVAALAGAGFAVRTTTNTWATRSLTTPPSSGLAITNQDGVFGSPAFTNTDKGSTAVSAHEAASDPHPQYQTAAESEATADARITLQKGAANGLAPLGADSKIPAIYIPGSIEEVLEFANFAAFPVTGEASKMYVALDTNRVYRWSGSAYVEISASPGSTDAVPEGASNLYFTEARVRAAVLTGLSLATNAVISATDTVLSALGKLQAQLTQAISDVNATFLLKANLSGGNTFTGNQRIEAASLTLYNASNPALILAANGGAGNSPSLEFKPFEPRTGGSSSRIFAPDVDFSSDIVFANAQTGSGANVATERMRLLANGQLSIGVTAPAASAKVQIDSTTQGFLAPRMTSTQRLAITSPVQGLQVYDTSLNALCIYTGTSWIFETTIRSASVSTSSTNVFGAVADLTSPSLDVGFYEFTATIVVQSTSTGTGLGVRLSSASSTANVLGQWKIPESGAVTGLSFVDWLQEANLDDGTSANAPFANQDFVVCGTGLLEIVTAGTVAINFRSELFGSAVSIRQRSILKLRKVN